MEDAGDTAQPNTPREGPRHRWRIWLVGYIESKLQQRKSKKEKETPNDRAARRTATATVCIAFFTVVTAAVSGGTLWILSGQLQEMRTASLDTQKLAAAAKSQADQAVSQTKAMEDSVRAMQDVAVASRAQSETLRLRDRAFVYFSDPIPVDFLVPYKGWDIRVIVQNSGNVPASKVVIRHTCVEAKKSQWHADLWKLGEWTKEPGPNILGPKNTFLFVACFLNANAIESLKSTDTIQFVMTEITYFDGFDQKKVRITRANRIFNFDSSGGHSFRFADYHNCSDDDCQSASHPNPKSSAKPN